MSETETVSDLADRVSGDPDLRKEERETTIGFAADQDRARVHSASPGVVRRLLLHDHVNVRDLTVVGPDGMEVVKPDRARETEGDIVAVRGTLPVGAISIKSVPRNHDQPAAVVSKGVLGE